MHGEEFGGPELTAGTVWVLDPIDGTYNYSAGLPLTGHAARADRRRQAGARADLVAAARAERYAGCVAGGPVLRNGAPLPPLPPRALRESMIAFGAFNVDSRGRYPGAFRLERARRAEPRAVPGAAARLAPASTSRYTAAGVLGRSHRVRPPRLGQRRRAPLLVSRPAAWSPTRGRAVDDRLGRRCSRGGPGVHDRAAAQMIDGSVEHRRFEPPTER